MIKVLFASDPKGLKNQAFLPRDRQLYKSEIWKSDYCCMITNIKKFYFSFFNTVNVYFIDTGYLSSFENDALNKMRVREKINSKTQ